MAGEVGCVVVGVTYLDSASQKDLKFGVTGV